MIKKINEKNKNAIYLINDIILNYEIIKEDNSKEIAEKVKKELIKDMKKIINKVAKTEEDKKIIISKILDKNFRTELNK